ncbi:GtrA family protein [Candidatus Mcinerneyibacteriota bacterium]|nr:GtrA family protein [Candidatus Mcinerneyibacteriota bacterium]
MIRRAGKFILTGISGTMVDTAVLWLLSRFLFSSYTGVYLIAPALSFEVAMLNNYIISYHWVWKKRVLKTAEDFFRRLIPYNLSCLAAFGVKMLFLILAERLFHLHVVYCNLIALTVSGGVNFLLGEHLIFSKGSSRK